MKFVLSATRLIVCLAALALVAGCGSSVTFNDKDSPEKLYADARDEMASGSYDKAIKMLERVEGRAAGTLLAQQAQLDQAYAQWRSGERATALSTLDRFIKVADVIDQPGRFRLFAGIDPPVSQLLDLVD